MNGHVNKIYIDKFIYVIVVLIMTSSSGLISLFTHVLIALVAIIITTLHWRSDTTGEKDFEEFFTDNEDLDMERFETVGVIRNQPDFDETKLDDFMNGIEALREKGTWTKDDIVKLYFGLLPEFAHKETGKYLDQRM